MIKVTVNASIINLTLALKPFAGEQGMLSKQGSSPGGAGDLSSKLKRDSPEQQGQY